MDATYSTQATSKEACLALRVTADTVRLWEKNGKIQATRTASGQRRYNLRAYFHPDYERDSQESRKYIYARVSSNDQKEDLERQIDVLRKKFPSHFLIKDVGSGLNFKRKGLSTLVDRILKGDVEEIVVTHRDRLCRFGFELFESLVSKSCPTGRIVVLDDKKGSPEQELTEDLISIITVFSSRLYGLRSHKNKNQENKTLSDSGGEETSEKDVSTFSLQL